MYTDRIEALQRAIDSYHRKIADTLIEMRRLFKIYSNKCKHKDTTTYPNHTICTSGPGRFNLCNVHGCHNIHLIPKG